MADAKEKIEEDIDTTAEKAKDIGKELGVVDDTPDYDIQEEDDDRIAKERNPVVKADKKERVQLSNKEKRDLRKKRINEKFNEKDALIQAQQVQIEQLNRWKSEVDGKLVGINKAEIDKAWNDTVAVFSQAEKDHANAFNEGDGTKATTAMRTMYDAQRKMEQIQVYKQALDKQPVAQMQTHPAPDRVLLSKKSAWETRNEWFDPNGRDADSEVARAIAGTIANEGYDPKTDDYWDELDERLSKYIPDKIKTSSGEDSFDDEEYQEEQKPRKRSGPPVSSGANRGDIKGKKTITLPTSYINMLKANGIWDDKKRRDKIIADRERIIKESGQ